MRSHLLPRPFGRLRLVALTVLGLGMLVGPATATTPSASSAAESDAAAATADLLRAQGAVTVLVQPPSEDQPPVLTKDEARVRSGDVVSVPVLRNDLDPDSDPITLESVDQATAVQLEAAGQGIVWTQGREVFFQGGQEGRYDVLYNVVAGSRRMSAVVTFVVTPPPDPATDPDRVHAWHLFQVKLPPGADRDGFLAGLRARGIGFSVHWRPLHLHPYWADAYGWRPEHLPAASAVWTRTVSLPIFPGMTEEELDAAVDVIAAVDAGVLQSLNQRIKQRTRA